ncbi:hypothetical protein [Saccharothrix sp. Mg75]|uniref:hypothetical protein n=1 Tax=Saccharothrix sp. Mg75 TaxID=3445357 RepID=UPI003EEC5E71
MVPRLAVAAAAHPCSSLRASSVMAANHARRCGLNGSVPPLTNASSPWGSQKKPLPLSRGYAVFSSDSGHQNKTGQHPATSRWR